MLFYGQGEFQAAFLDGMAVVPGGDPMVLVRAGLATAAALFPDERRPWSRMRQVVVDAHRAFQERELLKMSSLATAMADTLTERGVDPTTALLAAQTGVTIFRTAFATWIAGGEQRGFAEIQAAVLDELQALVSSG